MKTTEQFKRFTYTAPKTKHTIQLEVGDRGTIKYDGSKLKPFIINSAHGYKYVKAGDFNGMLPVHRLVALAWVKGKTKNKCFVDHINSKRGDNRASNL